MNQIEIILKELQEKSAFLSRQARRSPHGSGPASTEAARDRVTPALVSFDRATDFRNYPSIGALILLVRFISVSSVPPALPRFWCESTLMIHVKSFSDRFTNPIQL